MTSSTERRLKRLERRAEAVAPSPEERLARARGHRKTGRPPSSSTSLYTETASTPCNVSWSHSAR